MRLKGVVFVRVVVLVVSLTVFIGGSFSAFAVRHNRKEAEKFYTGQATFMGGGIERLLLWDDRVGIKRRLTSFVSGNDVLSYAFVTSGGEPLVWTFAEGVPDDLLKLSRSPANKPDKIEFRDQAGRVMCDIAIPLGRADGYFHIGLIRRQVDRTVFPLLMTIAALALVAVSAGLFLAFFLAGRAVREVEVLSDVVHSWVEGHEGKSRPLPSTSVEVADLARDFEQMREGRLKAEATIFEQHTDLTNVIGALTHPLYVINTEDYRVRMANPAAQDQGIEVGSLCYEATHGRSTPCDGIDHPCPLVLVRDQKLAATVEHVHTGPDGRKRTFEVHGFPVMDDHGSVSQLIEYTIDVTERNAAEEGLRRRNRELALLNWVIGSAASGMDEAQILRSACGELGRALEVDRVVAMMLDEAGTTARVVAEHRTEGLQSILGESFESGPGSVYGTVFGSRQPIVSPDVFSDPRFEAQRPSLAHIGIVSILLVPVVIEDGVRGVLGLATPKRRDYSDEEIGLALSVAGQLSSSLALAKVNATRKRLQTVIEQTEDCVVIMDTAGDIVYVNPAFEQITGYRQDEAIGKHPRFLDSGTHEDGFFEEMWSTLDDGNVWRGRIVRKKKDGTLFTEDAAITPVRSEDGKVSSFVAVNRDVTREIALEEQFLQAQKLEGLGRLAGGIAHDFNNLLGAIMGYAELGQAQLEDGSRLHNLLGEMISASDQAARLTRQLLIFARNQPSEVSIICANDVVLGVDRVFQRLIGEDIEIESNLQKDLPRVRVNPSQFEQVILNLLVNARDAMPVGGRITIETSTTDIEAVMSSYHGDMRPGRYVVLSIADTGIGMPVEIREQIFEPFFSTKERSRGTGLGLSTCYGIVTEAGGYILVDTAEGKGTTIRVFLPASDPESEDEKDQFLDRNPAPTGGMETVLLAEDDQVIRTLLCSTLREFGYRVLEANDGEDALNKAADHEGPIDVLVTDVVMPRLGGPDLAASLVQGFPEIEVVFISGHWEDPLSMNDFSDATFMKKPFRPLALANTIREILDR